MVFAVFDSSSISGSGPGTYIEPMVVIKDGQYTKPPDAPSAGENTSTRPSPEFVKRYYVAGAEYPLYFGGNRVGAAKAEKPQPVSCSALTALVQTQGLAPLQTANFALAVAGPPPASHASERRLANPKELQWALSFAQKMFRTRGVRKRDAYKVQAGTVIVTDVDRDGQNEIIGSYQLPGPQTMRRLFMMLYNTGTGYQPLIVEYHATADPDMRDDKNETFVDQIDLEGDGMDELFTRSFYYQRWDYSLYKRGATGWQKVYHGGGGGC